MKRSDALVSLSRDHHAALVHALRLKRATVADLETTVAVFLAFLLGDGRRHFTLEESVVLPALPVGATALCDRVRAEHTRIYEAARALGGQPEVAPARALGHLLADHVRFEERELFAMVEELPDHILIDVARRLDGAETVSGSGGLDDAAR
jgi:Hemerythrin HHE cation binding domain